MIAPRRRRRARLGLLLAAQLLALLGLAACAGQVGVPEGWSAAAVATDVQYRGQTYDEVVVLGTREGEVIALDARADGGGETIWTFQLRGEEQRRAIYGTPAVDGDVVYVGAYDGRLYVIGTDGEDLDDVEVGDGDPIVGSAVVVDDKVLIGSSDGRLYAFEILREERGLTLVGLWTARTEGKVWSTPAVDGGVVYFGSLDHRVYAVSLEDGQPVWDSPFEANGAFTSRPAIADGNLYIGSFDGVFYSLDVATGRERAKFKGASGWFWADPVVVDGVVFAPSLDGNLYALDADTLEPRWSEPLRTDGPILGSPAVIGDRIAVPSLKNKVATVHVVRLRDGDAEETCSFGGRNGAQIRSALTVFEDAVYVVANDRSVRRLSVDSRGDPDEEWVRFTDEEYPRLDREC